MAGAPREDRHRHVVVNLPMRLVSDVDDIEVDAEFHYATRDPFAVRVTFCRSGFAPVVWSFARDLLLIGVAKHAGIGDVQVEPDGESVVLDLASPEGTARLVASGVDIRRFVSRMVKVVPAGDEANYVDIDAEISALTQTMDVHRNS